MLCCGRDSSQARPQGCAAQPSLPRPTQLDSSLSAGGRRCPSRHLLRATPPAATLAAPGSGR
eukprot:scaffold12212_cov122-Isochrysis_galbana.AAC.9